MTGCPVSYGIPYPYFSITLATSGPFMNARNALAASLSVPLRSSAAASPVSLSPDARQMPLREPGLVHALGGGLADRGKTAPQAKAEIGRSCYSLAENFTRGRAEASATV